MLLILLPPYVVPYLDALALPECEPADYVEGFRQALQTLGAWLDFQATFSVNDEEEGQLENLGYLLSVLEGALELGTRKAQLNKIVPALYEVVGLMEAINERRDKPHFSPQSAINDLVLAGGAYIQKRGQARAVTDRLERLGEYYTNLRQNFRGAKARLKPEIVESLEVGLKQLKAGLEHAWEAVKSEDRAALHDSLAEISEGSQVTQFLVDWYRQDTQRLAARHTRFQIPLVGPMLELYLESARQFDKEQWARGLKGIYRDELPKLFVFWGVAEKKIYLPLEEREPVIERVEAGFWNLKAALQTMEDPEASKEEGVEAFEASLDELSQAFQEIQKRIPTTSHLKGSQAGDYFELFAGALDGHVPIVAFSEMVHASPPPPHWSGILQLAMAYCQDGDVEHLYSAITELVTLFPAPREEEHPQSWACPYCSNVNQLGHKTCSACNRSPQLQNADVNWNG